MGRFYASLNRLKHDELLKQSNDKLFATLIELHMMFPIDKLSQKHSNSFADRNGDIIMTETTSTPPISPFREEFSFEWFSFDSNKRASKVPLFSPISPASPALEMLSGSTASLSDYFSDPSPTAVDFNKPKLYELNGRRPRTSQLVLPYPPSKPLNWIWQCHMCRNRYPLAVTRRCLVDGHYYCSGITTTSKSNQRNVKRRKANRSCTSEFDYVGWQDWDRWSRKCKALQAYTEGKEIGPILNGCEGCIYPSQCRYASRPPKEKLEFSDYINHNDLDAMLVDEVEELISPESRAFEEERLTRSSESTTSIPKQTQTIMTTPQGGKDATPAPKLENTQVSSLISNKSATSRRQRFYSSITSSISSVNSNSARDNSDKGKFDPTLPSVSIDSTTSDQRPPRRDGEIYINAIEANLKSALPSQTFTTQPSTRRSQSSPQIQTVPSKVKTKKHLNSKTDDPEFEVLIDDVKTKVQDGGTSKIFKPGGGFTRTRSEQSLITDLFRQIKGSSATKDNFCIGRANQASSEADIVEFLQLRGPKDNTVKQIISTPISVDSVKIRRPQQQFREIELTPRDIKPGSTFANILLSTIGVCDDTEAESDPVKKDLQSIADETT